MSSVYDDVMNIFNGQTPIKRQNPGKGESQYYFVNPGQNNFTSFSDVKTTDIPDEQPLFDIGQGLKQVQNQPQNSAWNTAKSMVNNFAGGTEAFSVGYATGTSLGNFDEGMGVATAAVTGNPNNYAMGRDATRQLQNDLQQQHPIAYGVGEMLGAAQSPMHLFKDTTSGYRAINALTDTLNASAGYAENWNDFGTNLITNGIANAIGFGTEFLPGGRALGVAGRKALTHGINYTTNKAKDIFYGNENK